MIFLDNNATTPLAQEVINEMIAYSAMPLNPSSVHSCGRNAKNHLIQAKDCFAHLLNVKSDEIIFTSGGTESMNMLIKGLYPGYGKILTSTLEHPCVTESIQSLELNKSDVLYTKASSYGAPKIEDLEEHLHENITLMVFSAVYSETGVKLDLNSFATLAEHLNIPLIIDGVALLGKEKFTIPFGVTGMGFSSHKIHGPQGVGAAFLSQTAPFKPLIVGGSQQMGKRAGTENLLGIIGFKKALQLAYEKFPSSTLHMQNLQTLIVDSLKSLPTKVHINGDGPKVCNTLNLYFEDVDAETLLLSLDRQDMAVSMGSACCSGSLQPSKILQNMGYDALRVKNSLRFSWSRYTQEKDIKKALQTLSETLIKTLSVVHT